MSRIRTALIWLWMLAKRLYKKPSFLLILLLIPAMVLGYRASTNESSSMMSVALVMDGNDPLTAELSQTFSQTGQLLNCLPCDMDTANQLLVTGKVDAIWHFPENLTERLRLFSQKPSASNAFIDVIVREQTVPLRLSQEKISGVLFEPIARYVYLDQLRQVAPELAHMSDEALLTYYDQTYISDSLFSFQKSQTANAIEGHYLLSPLRGLLGIIAILCALSASMYYLTDRKRGTFAWVSRHRQSIPEFANQFVSVFHVVVCAWVCLGLTGLSGGFFRELVVTVAYTVCCCAFSMVLRRIFNSIRSLGALLPLLITLMLVICPVFFNFGPMRPMQYLLPPTYYIHAVSNSLWLGYMLVYTLICFGIYFLLGCIPKKD